MGLIQHIPQAMMQSLGFMAMLFLLFEGIQFWFKPSSNQKYWLACTLYGAALVHFLYRSVAVKVIVQPQIFIPIEIPNQLQWMSLIGVLYLMIVIGYFFYFLFRWIQLQQLQSNADFNSAIHVKYWLAAQVQNTGSNQKIQIGFSKQVNGPVIFGWIEPVILIPFSLLNHISTEEMKFILLHELAHILRNDFIIHLFVEIAQMILCFNPFSYYFSKIIRLEREKACDEWVIAQTKDPLLYTKALYQLAKYNYKNSNELSLAAVDSGSELLLRIRHINRIIASRDTTKVLLSRFLLGLGVALFFVLNIALVPTNVENTKYIQATKPAFSVQNKELQVSKSKKQFLSTQSKVRNEHYKAHSRQPFTKSEIVMNKAQDMHQDSNYIHLVNATIAWIKAREMNQNNEAVFVQYDSNKAYNEYSIAEQLLLRAVLHKYELKRTILANAIAKANSQEEALSMIHESKEWLELQQYEKWASRFLKQHPNLKDSSKVSDF